MKCPKCGFVSYAGLEKCKRCGYQYVKVVPKGPPSSPASSPFTSLFPEGTHTLVPPPPAMSPEAADDVDPSWSAGNETARNTRPAPFSDESPGSPAGVEESAQDWREELSDRVDNFRKKRARLQGTPEPPENLALDFERATEAPKSLDVLDPLGLGEDHQPEFDVELGDSTAEQSSPTFEMSSHDRGEDDSLTLEAPDHAVEEEMSLGDAAPVSHPMEIVVGSPGDSAYAEEEETPESMPLAPVGARFLAGMTDALVLAVGAALFGLIFWRSGGHISPHPLNYAVVGAMVLMLIFSYFGLFTALTATTPGLLLMGFEIRNLQGLHPTVRESCWRAFGVLVSTSALLLGFIWAWVDSQGLTWHDRMSGTFITLAHAVHHAPDLDSGF